MTGLHRVKNSADSMVPRVSGGLYGVGPWRGGERLREAAGRGGWRDMVGLKAMSLDSHTEKGPKKKMPGRGLIPLKNLRPGGRDPACHCFSAANVSL